MPQPGYYSSLFDNMIALKNVQRQNMTAQVSVQNQQQEMQKRQQDMRIAEQDNQAKRKEEKLLEQAFAGGQEFRQGMQEADTLMMQADKLMAAGAKIMGVNPKRGAAMILEANTLKNSKSQQDLHNANLAKTGNELLNTVAMKVNDQASTDDAVQELAAAGHVVPMRFRKWNPDSQKYWESRAAVSKQNVDMLKIDLAEQRARIAADAEARLKKTATEETKRKDDEAARKRAGQGQAVDIAAEKEYDRLRKEFDLMEKPGWFTDAIDQKTYDEMKSRVQKAKDRAYGTGEAASNNFGKRQDGSDKGTGWLGVLKRPDGNISTELSVGVNINGKETEIPLLVPGLSQDEIKHLLNDGKPTSAIMQKAVTHAKGRIAAGKSPFADSRIKSVGNITTVSDSEAVAWAKANPNDPRARKIMELNKGAK